MLDFFTSLFRPKTFESDGNSTVAGEAVKFIYRFAKNMSLERLDLAELIHGTCVAQSCGFGRKCLALTIPKRKFHLMMTDEMSEIRGAQKTSLAFISRVENPLSRRTERSGEISVREIEGNFTE